MFTSRSLWEPLEPREPLGASGTSRSLWGPVEPLGGGSDRCPKLLTSINFNVFRKNHNVFRKTGALNHRLHEFKSPGKPLG